MYNNNNMIIHISGPSGSGKTTLGKSLKVILDRDETILFDLDDILHKHIERLERTKLKTSDIFTNFNSLHQNIIDEIIDKNSSKNIIFVGLSFDLKHGRPVEFRDDTQFLHNLNYDVHADYKFYIDVPVNEHMRRLFDRSIDELCHDKDWYFQEWLKNPDEAIKMLNHSININHWVINRKKWDKLYRQKGYIFMSPKELQAKVLNILT